jgi:alpha-N-arabinofuranosidase
MRLYALVAASTLGLALLPAHAATSASAPSSADTIAIQLDAQKGGAKIDRNIFGQFAEHLGRGVYEGIWVGPSSPIPNTRGIRNDVVKALQALHVPNVRWPGGCFADEYHWRKGIGPPSKRPATVNANWGGVIERNTFGTHELMDFLQQIGAEAYVSINVGSGTPQEAAEWLDYMTAGQPTALARERAANGHPAPYKVGFVGLGNESWGCGGSMTPDYYVSQLKIYARYVRSYNSARPTLKIAVGPNEADTSYTEAVMKAWQSRPWSWDIDGLSMHAYTVVKWPPSYKATGFGESEYASFIKATLRMDGLIQAQSAIMDRYDPQRKVSLVIDEWGSWLAPTPGSPSGFLEQQNSQRDAVVAALNINTFARHAERVRMANIAQMINVLQAMVLTDKEKMILTPTYYVFRMYVPFQDATFIPLSFDAGSYVNGDITLPRVDAVAARDQQGRVWLALTNIDPHSPAQIEVTVAGTDVTRVAGEMLSAPAIDSVNTFAAPLTVAPHSISAQASGGKIPLTLAPESVTVVTLEN